MAYMNLIYLGYITDRIPVIPMFNPAHHIGADAPKITFGEIFDIPRFTNESGISIVEWKEVKDSASGVVDDLGCWGVWQTVQHEDKRPRQNGVTGPLGLGAYLRNLL